MAQALAVSETTSLEDRLNKKDERIRQQLITELLKPKRIPSDIISGKVQVMDTRVHAMFRKRYLKDDLAPYIVTRLLEDGVNFDNVGGSHNFKENIYHSVLEEPMKRVFWGQFNAYAPTEIMQELHPWAAFYMYAGIWTKKTTPLQHKRFFYNNMKNQPSYKIIYECVKEGMETIKKVHNSEHMKGNYKSMVRNAPHKMEVFSMMPKPIATNYAQLGLPFQL